MALYSVHRWQGFRKAYMVFMYMKTQIAGLRKKTGRRYRH